MQGLDNNATCTHVGNKSASEVFTNGAHIYPFHRVTFLFLIAQEAFEFDVFTTKLAVYLRGYQYALGPRTKWEECHPRQINLQDYQRFH